MAEEKVKKVAADKSAAPKKETVKKEEAASLYEVVL